MPKNPTKKQSDETGMGFNGVVNLRQCRKICYNDVDLLVNSRRFWKFVHVLKWCCKSITTPLNLNPVHEMKTTSVVKASEGNVPESSDCVQDISIQTVPKVVTRKVLTSRGSGTGSSTATAKVELIEMFIVAILF